MGMASTYVWWTERSAVWIAYYDVSKSITTAFSSPDDATKDVHIFFYKKADPFKKEGDSVPDRSVISKLFNLVMKNLQKGYNSHSILHKNLNKVLSVENNLLLVAEHINRHLLCQRTFNGRLYRIKFWFI